MHQLKPIVCSRQRGLQSTSFGLRPYGDAPDADEALHCHVLSSACILEVGMAVNDKTTYAQFLIDFKRSHFNTLSHQYADSNLYRNGHERRAHGLTVPCLCV